MWREYENQGWPARYLFDGRARLFEYHFGEGAYAETELAIQELLGVQREPLRAAAPGGRAGCRSSLPQTEDQQGAYSGPYEAGGVWAVLDGSGSGVNVSARRPGDVAEPLATEWRHPPGRLPLIEHERHTDGGAGPGDRPGRAVLRDLLHAGLGVGLGEP